MIFIVVNSRGLNVRSKPDTKTGAVVRTMANGEGFQVYDVFTLGNQTWGRVSRGDGVIQEYSCIAIGNKIYARQQDQGSTIPGQQPAGGWASELVAWARTKGYTGSGPA